MGSEQSQQISIGKYTSKFTNRQKIGSGGYGQVYIGYQKNNINNKVAIKIINLQLESDKDKAKNQVLNMINAKSSGIVEVLASGVIKFGMKNQDSFAIVMEYMDGSIKDLLKQKGPLNQIQAIQWIQKIVKCYKSLYDSNIIHRDLKPDNILFKIKNNQLIFKITDFGIARSAYQTSKSFTVGAGTLDYLSPQQARKGNYTNKTDVYALGVIFFQLLNGVQNTPLSLNVINHTRLTLDQQQFKHIMEKIKISKICQLFIFKCLAYGQQLRLSWEQIFHHQIFDLKKNKNNDNNEDYYKTMRASIINEELLKFPSNIQQLLKGIKRISISPNQEGYFFKNKCILINQENPFMCSTPLYYGYMFSNQELPIKNESFYFVIKAIQIACQKYIEIGIAFPNSIQVNGYSKDYNCVGYSLSNTQISFFDKEFKIKPEQSNQIHKMPCLIIVLISQKNKRMYIIYNNLVQITIPLQKQMTHNINKCYAYLQNGAGGLVQFM